MLLQLDGFVGGQQPFVRRPGPGKLPSPAQAVGEMPNRERIGRRVVVALDDEVVAKQQEGRAACAGRCDQLRLVAWPRKIVAASASKPKLLPCADALLLSVPGERIVEVLRKQHLVAPGRARYPSGLGEIICGRADRVGKRIPQVASAVAIKIDCIGFIGRGDELRVAHGARPRASHTLDRDVTALQDFESRDELLAPELGAPPVSVSQRCQRTDHAFHDLRVGENLP